MFPADPRQRGLQGRRDACGVHGDATGASRRTGRWAGLGLLPELLRRPQVEAVSLHCW